MEEQGQPSWSNLGTTHWLLTTAIMLSDMFGLGTLSLPADFARLGWIPALACLAWFAAADVYAGTVYQRLSIKIPSAVVFDEIGYAAMGRLGSALVYATIYFSILLQPIMLHLTCMETLRQVSVLHKLRPMQPGMTAITSPCRHVVVEPFALQLPVSYQNYMQHEYSDCCLRSRDQQRFLQLFCSPCLQCSNPAGHYLPSSHHLMRTATSCAPFHACF